jgi:hypothetical protein
VDFFAQMDKNAVFNGSRPNMKACSKGMALYLSGLTARLQAIKIIHTTNFNSVAGLTMS